MVLSFCSQTFEFSTGVLKLVKLVKFTPFTRAAATLDSEVGVDEDSPNF